MDEVKYIIYKDRHGFERAVIFDPMIQHSSMAMGLCVTDNVVGAGFVSGRPLKESVDTVSGMCRDIDYRAYGQSISLGVKSREPQDSEVINAMFFTRDEVD
jgi:hypothetical protein